MNASLRKTIYLLSLTAVFLLSALPLAAQEGAGWTATADHAFGQVVTFHLEGPADVTRATLFFQAPEFDTTFAADVPLPATAGDGQPLRLSYPVDLSRVRFAPFTTVTYWWVVETAVAAPHTLPRQTLYYQDDQFTWRELGQDRARVFWSGDDLALGQLALDVVAEALPRWEAILPLPPDLAFDLYLYPSSADLRAALRLTGRDWVGAHAHPELGVLLVTAVNSRTAPTDLRQSIPHELAHYLLYQSFGPVAYEAIPHWLNEGLATLLEARPNPNYALVLETAVANFATLPLADLCEGFPAAEERAVLAYAQSESLLHYVRGQYGNQTVQNLLAAYADGLACDAGVQRVLGRSLADLERDWLAAQQPQAPLARFLGQNGLWLLLLVGSFRLTGLIIWQQK
jgi:hypothetical protein